MNVTTSL
jgi:hypothetical protein